MILIVAELTNGKLSKSTYELTAAARGIGREGPVTVLVMGSGVAAAATEASLLAEQVLVADLAFAVGEGVEEREPDDVRFGAGGDLRDDLVVRFGGEFAVGVVPQLACFGPEPDVPGCS